MRSSLFLLVVVALAACTQSRFSADLAPNFKPISVNYTRHWDKITHPFTGAAAIDIKSNNQYAVFVGGSQNQADALFMYENGKLIDKQAGTGLSPTPKTATYGATAIDINNDGRTDLIVARDDGVYLYLNLGNGTFEQRRIMLNMPVNASPFHVAVADIDHDGDADLYISMFVNFAHFRSATFNDPQHAKPNRMLLNNGDLTFTDITQSSGTAGVANTFESVFVDLDNDGWQDLVVANNTGPIEIFKNLHNNTFERLIPFAPFGFWMGVGVGDIDNDGDQDLFFPNVGDSIPLFLTKGDLHSNQTHTHDWLLLRNDGNFKFSNITVAKGLGNEGFGWGGVFEDLNLDGKLDLSVAQNYIKWPLHKWFKLSGRTFLQTESNSFLHNKTLGLESKNFTQSTLIVDLDGDGRQDFLWIPMQGPVQAYLNTSKNNFITLKLPADVATLGTRVRVKTADGVSYSKEIIAGQGFMTGNAPEISFGLGHQTEISSIEVTRPNGKTTTIPAIAINQKWPVK